MNALIKRPNFKPKIEAEDFLFALMIITLAIFNFQAGLNNFVNILIFIFSAFVILKNLQSGTKIPWIIYWFAGFLLVSYLVSLLGADLTQSLKKIKSLTSITVLVLALSFYWQKKEKLTFSINVFICALLLSCLYIVVSENIFSGDRIGESIGDVNTVGIYLSCLAMVLLYSFIVRKQIWKLAVFFVTAVLILLTGSRTALFSIIGGTVVIMLAYGLHQKRFIRTFLVLAGACTVFLVLVYQVDILYKVIGVRIDSMIAILTGKDSAINEGSTTTRLNYIALAWKLFTEHPILGIGLDNFAVEAQRVYGTLTFSHNNYVELLCSGGIFLFCVYYSLHIYLLAKSIILWKRAPESRGTVILALGLMAVILISDFFLVKYYQKFEFVFLLFCYQSLSCVSEN